MSYKGNKQFLMENRPKFWNFSSLNGMHNITFSSKFDAVFILWIDCDKAVFQQMSSVGLFKLSLMAVKLLEEKVIDDLLWSYHAVPLITLYCTYIKTLS